MTELITEMDNIYLYSFLSLLLLDILSNLNNVNVKSYYIKSLTSHVTGYAFDTEYSEKIKNRNLKKKRISLQVIEKILISLN